MQKTTLLYLLQLLFVFGKCYKIYPKKQIVYGEIGKKVDLVWFVDIQGAKELTVLKCGHKEPTSNGKPLAKWMPFADGLHNKFGSGDKTMQYIPTPGKLSTRYKAGNPQQYYMTISHVNVNDSNVFLCKARFTLNDKDETVTKTVEAEVTLKVVEKMPDQGMKDLPMIIGGSIGGLVFLVMIVACVVYWQKRDMEHIESQLRRTSDSYAEEDREHCGGDKGGDVQHTPHGGLIQQDRQDRHPVQANNGFSRDASSPQRHNTGMYTVNTAMLQKGKHKLRQTSVGSTGVGEHV